MSLLDRVLTEAKLSRYDVPVDTGSVIVVDPCYLFTNEEWQKIIEQDDMHRAIFDRLREKVGTKFVEGAYVGTGGDATFRVRPGKHGVPIVIESEGEWDETFTVSVRGDEGGLRKLLTYIRETAGIGHSFEVVVDPENSDYRKRFDIDGDGPFRMEIK